MKFLLNRKLAFTCFDDLAEFLVGSSISIIAVDHVMVGTWTESFFESQQTREDALFAFVIQNTPDMEAANLLLDSTLDNFDED